MQLWLNISWRFFEYKNPPVSHDPLDDLFLHCNGKASALFKEG